LTANGGQSPVTWQGIVYHFGPIRFVKHMQFDIIMPVLTGRPRGVVTKVEPIQPFLTAFLHDDSGAVTVDWTMLGAAAVGLSLATAAMLTDTLDTVISRVDNELRTQQLNDDFVQFTSAHIERLYAFGNVDAETAESLFTIANDMMNQEILDGLAWGLEQMQSGAISSNDMVALYAVASVAYQRNLVPDQILEGYFGFAPSANGDASAAGDMDAAFATGE